MRSGDQTEHSALGDLDFLLHGLSISLLLAWFVIIFAASQASAQWVGNDLGMCPNGRWVTIPAPGGTSGARCIPNEVEEQPQSVCPAGMEYCPRVNLCCGSGNYCSIYGCTPIGAIDCGGYYCKPGKSAPKTEMVVTRNTSSIVETIPASQDRSAVANTGLAFPRGTPIAVVITVALEQNAQLPPRRVCRLGLSIAA